MIITPNKACHGKSFDGLLKKYFGKNELPYVSKIFVSIKGNGMEFPFLFLFFIAFEQKQKNGGRSAGEACRLPKEPEIEKQIVPKQILSTLKHASLRL